jgi:hypothetical protein
VSSVAVEGRHEMDHPDEDRRGLEDHHDWAGRRGLEDHCDWGGRYGQEGRCVMGRDWEEEACVKRRVENEATGRDYKGKIGGSRGENAPDRIS